MVIDLLLVVFLVAILWNISKKDQNMKAYKARYNSQTATYIKYDKRSVKAWSIAVAVTGIVFGVSIFLMNTDVDFWGKSKFSNVAMVLLVTGLLMGGLLLIWFIYHLLAGVFYLKRLERYDYEIPEDKRAYECMLEQVPRYGMQRNTMTHSPTSKCLALLCVLMAVVMVGCSCYFLYKWRFMGDDTVVLFVLLLIADAFWILPALFFRNQMNMQKFKDDVEIDANRKDRMNICSGIAVIVVLVGVALGVKWLAYNMSEFVFKSQMIEDQKKIVEIRDVMEIACMDPYVIANDDNLEETKHSLEAGVDITDWNVTEGEFQEQIAKMLEITDFSELKDAFYSADGPAIVYVKLEGEEFTVQLMNVYPAADREIIAGPPESN